MKTNFYLVVNAGGSVRTVKTKPNLQWDEVAIHLNLELPPTLFQKPQLNASIIVGAENVIPTEISVETADNIRDAITAAAGMEVRLEIVEPDKD